MKCDVLVIGAGPAGSSAAYACASAGLDTVFIDRKRDVGVPVTCSGAIGSYLIPFLPFKIPNELLTHRIKGLEFFVDDISYTRRGGPWESYAVDRSSFDLWLAERACGAGAKLLLETEFLELAFDNIRRAEKAEVKRKGGIEEIEFKVLIGADGAESGVLEKLGERNKDARLGRAVVYEYSGVRLGSPEMDQLYFGDFAPGGYAHIFPLSDDRVNIGVGSIASEVDIRRCFEDFIKEPRISVQLEGAKLIREKSGVVAFDRLSTRWQYGNVLLAGEAASQNIKPLVEGFLPSIICGDVAGKTAVRHLVRGESLESYKANVDRKLGLIYRESDRLIGLLEGLSDMGGEKSHLLLAGLCGNVFSKGDVEALKEKEYGAVKARLVDWKNGWAKQVLTSLSERAGISYLNAMRLVNSKVYKL